ncbi:glycosyl transferase group 1 [Clostridium sp. DL-VIII]|uniref:glycosyltransferase family 4 protein n=1 Tax=Clostridium sp. DL-VIII TaxID=641107 RepID=UPI00023AF941|nr:glycosyltransferase family 4 protein [Clostridium sp. DL-VIII]EHI99327.1 glycosyl transferase group 1 [Clostridium sp. DL-VIII]
MRKLVMHIAQAAGGVERYMIMLLENMNKSEYRNIVVCSYDFNIYKLKDISEVIEQVKMHRKINLFKDIIAIYKVRRLIKKYKPDILYMHSSKAGMIGRLANLGLKTKVVYNPHGWAFNMRVSKIKQKAIALAEKILSNFCNRIIAISDAERESALSMDICSENKIEVIFSGIDIEKFKEITKGFTLTREMLGISKEAYVIGMVGRITKQKAPDTFIKAAVEIRKIITNAYFIIVGDGEEKKQLLKLINKNDMEENVLITGWVDNPLEYVRLFDIAMMLSRWEGFGLALTEYMISKKPVIATNVDSIPNLINHDINGYLVKVDDIKQIVDGVIKIHSNFEYKESLISNSFNRVIEKFNIKRVVKSHEKLFAALINEGTEK